MTSEQLIKDPVKRKERAEEKEAAVLRFLRDEVYSSTALLAVEMGVGERAARNVLNRMHSKRLLVKDEVKFMGMKALPLWGITSAGIMSGLEPEEVKTVNLRHHTAGRVSPRTIEHTLDVQRCRQYCLYQLSCRHWVPTRLLAGQNLKRNSPLRWSVYPDGVVQYPSKSGALVPVALEVERTRKTPARYIQIINGHLRNIRNDHYYRVVYYCQTQKEADSLKALFLRLMLQKNITHYVSSNQTYTPEQSLTLFAFVSLEKRK